MPGLQNLQAGAQCGLMWALEGLGQDGSSWYLSLCIQVGLPWTQKISSGTRQPGLALQHVSGEGRDG